MRTFEDIMDTILDNRPVTDLGQFDKKTKRLLDKAAELGAISKGKGGEFPKIKTVYAPKGFDFEAHRKDVITLVDNANDGIISPTEYIHHKFDYRSYIKYTRAKFSTNKHNAKDR